MDFLDVHVDKDNRLYVDPSAIRYAAKAGEPWATSAYRALTDFFDEILRRLKNASRHRDGESMLTEFHEPRETRLGMSKFGYDGSGASREIGERIWAAIKDNPLCLIEVPILKRVEHLPMFVDDLSNDRVSDLTSRIIFDKLVAFTLDQATKHPSITLGEPMEFQVWDTAAGVWSTKTYALPDAGTAKQEPLLLVPKHVVFHSLRMSNRGYWSVPVLGAVQDSQTTIGGNGKPIAPSKESLKDRDDLKDNIRETNQQWTEREWIQRRTNLLERYEEFVDGKFTPLDDDEILNRLGL
ncbi:hypothetical protein [Isoptericola sp. NPDC057559]|uniref:hypothetical protein n=1 Tax=Isoptericola sp. NPDC057559 TaxID=3346168 RepID=UPI0036748A57